MNQNKDITLGSLFSGSGGFELAGILSGITPLWNSEIEPFAIRVTTKRLPRVKSYGDVSALNGADLEPVDVITFGSPCQNMSMAGNRVGLDGEQSQLFHEAIRIIKEMREATNERYPRYILWENVDGAFSSNRGEDFRRVLEEICKVKDGSISIPRPEGKWTHAGQIMGDGFSVAWRLLDAQYWGVPQRRKRIYLVADFAGGSAGKVLFESEGLSRYSAESFRSWQKTSNSLETCTGEAGGGVCLNDQGGERMDVSCGEAGTLRAEAHGHNPCVLNPAVAIENHPADSRVRVCENGIFQTLTERCGTGGGNVPMVMEQSPKTLKIRSGCEGGGKGALIQDNKSATLACSNDQTVFIPTAYGVCSKESNSMRSSNPDSGFYEAGTSKTLDRNGGNPSCAQGGIAVIEGNGSRPSHKGDGYRESETMYTLNCVEHHGVAYGIDRASFNMGKNAAYKPIIGEEVEPPVIARGPNAVAHPAFLGDGPTAETTYCAGSTSNAAIGEGVTPTLLSRDYKDPPYVNEPGYVVRRLTPVECARLQGFPDWWCMGLETENPTDDEIAFWREVFNTQSRINGVKAKSDSQIVRWLRNPYSDSSEYRLWGNGIALPCAVFVLSGIEYYFRQDE